MIYTYKGRIIRIVPDRHKGQIVYNIMVGDKCLTFVKDPKVAKEIAVNFIDVISDEGYMTSSKRPY